MDAVLNEGIHTHCNFLHGRHGHAQLASCQLHHAEKAWYWQLCALCASHICKGMDAWFFTEMYLLLQVYASYRYRRDLADAAKISGVFGRSRILKREEAIKQKVSMSPDMSALHTL